MDVNEEAPVVASSHLEIAAAPASVWRTITDIGRWPDWNPDVRAASMEGSLAPGTAFRWKAGPGTITSVLRHVEEPREVGWTGRTYGIRAVHVYRLEPSGEGTHVTSEESWEGVLARLLPGMMRKSLQEAIDSGLRHLKREAERPRPPLA
ncbi:MAG: polyketide cyclase [Dehalococcoidia bacterium]|nr:polyketide cyclase [Dehalococcoidia bacterium]